MLPGTYVPTETNELQAFAMERLRTAWHEFSRQVAAIEAHYLSIGMEYHHLPLLIREGGSQDNVQICFETFVVQPAEQHQRLNTGTPLFIQDLRALRRCRDDAKVAMSRGDAEAAENLIDAPGLVSLVHTLAIVQNAVRDMMDAWLDGDTAMDGPPDYEEMLALRRQWILSIPFVADSIEKGFANEEQAYRMAVHAEMVGDDGFLDSVVSDPHYEMSGRRGSVVTVDSGEEV